MAKKDEASCTGDVSIVQYVPHQFGGDGLTRDIINAFCNSVSGGVRKNVVAARLQIPMSTYNQWMQAGKTEIRMFEAGRRDSIGLYGEFVVKLQAAEAEFHENCVGTIMASGDAKLIWAYLQKRFPGVYGSTVKPAHDEDTETEAEAEDDATAILIQRMKAVGPMQ